MPLFVELANPAAVPVTETWIAVQSQSCVSNCRVSARYHAVEPTVRYAGNPVPFTVDAVAEAVLRSSRHQFFCAFHAPVAPQQYTSAIQDPVVARRLTSKLDSTRWESALDNPCPIEIANAGIASCAVLVAVTSDAAEMVWLAFRPVSAVVSP